MTMSWVTLFLLAVMPLPFLLSPLLVGHQGLFLPGAICLPVTGLVMAFCSEQPSLTSQGITDSAKPHGENLQ